jgi:uncharacterized protein HemX
MDNSAAQTTQPVSGANPTPPASTTSQSAPMAAPQSSSPMTPQKPSGSTNKGLILSIIIVVLVVVGVGVYAFMSKQSPSSDSMNSLTSQVSHAPQMSVVPSNAMQMNQGAQGNGLTSGTTNTDLTQDANTLNKQLDSASSEMNNVDQGLNDQPANLSQ